MRRRLTPVLLPPANELSVSLRVRCVIEILLSATRVRLQLRRRNVTEIAARLRRGVISTASPDYIERVGVRLGQPILRTLSVFPGDSRCLVRSLVLLDLLACRGISADLVIGADVVGGFKAHAWVEYQNRKLLPSLGYAPLTVI